ncbi:hypothetical protein UlMin_018086 [Ulmus minor]
MVTANRSSDPVDPLRGYSGIALFPKPFGVSPDPSKPYDFDDDLQATHHNLKSMALRSPSRLKEHARNIVDGKAKNLNSNITSYQASGGKNDYVPSIEEENPRKRRPALGRKRARFSLKPDSSQPARTFGTTLDIKKLNDPEEFFKAYERHENAKREIQKQMGGIQSESDQQELSPIKQSRRPGLLGRAVRYKHLYSAEKSETSNKVISSQETFESSNPSPLSQRKIDHNFTSSKIDLTSSIAEGEERVDEILDDLLSRNCEDLEGDGALNLLQERLQIKSIELEKLCLPDFPDIPKIDMKSSRIGKLPKRSRVLSDIDNLLKGTSSKTTKRQRVESSLHHLTSPSPPKNPFSSFSSLLNKSVLRSSPSSDPFSAHNVDQLPVTNHSSIEHIDKHVNIVDEVRQSDTMELPQFEQSEVEFAESSSLEVACKDSTQAHGKTLNDDSSQLEGVIDVDSSASHVAVGDDVTDNDMGSRVMSEKLGGHVVADAQTNGANVEENVKDTVQEVTVLAQSDLYMVDSTLDKLKNTQNHLDKPSTVLAQDDGIGGHSNIPDNGSEQHTEEVQQHSRIPVTKQSKAKSNSRKTNKTREISRRKSLAGAGMMWESGLRRSTRIKTRPLEYWRGERLLYGRIHQSLPTVIGLKYSSPDKGKATPILKVKSFVNDEYKDLVEKAALH